MISKNLTKILAITAIGMATMLSTYAVTEASPVTVEEAITGLYPTSDFSISDDGKTVFFQVNAAVSSNGPAVLFDISTGKGQDLWADNAIWVPSGGGRYRLATYGPEKKLVGSAVVEGKTWAALRSPSSPEPELLFRFPLSMSGMYFGSVNGNMIYMISQSSGTRPRTRPEEDSPPTVDVKTRMRVHTSYFPDVNRNPFVKAYPEAYAKQRRDHYVLFNPKTRELRKICSGNDSYAFLHVGGKKLVIWQHRNAEEYKGISGDETQYGDFYIVPVPGESELPLIDLEQEAKVDPMLAGWSDHKNAILKPTMTALEGITSGQWSPDGRLLRTVRYDWHNSENHIAVIDPEKREVRELSQNIPLSETKPRLTFGEEWSKPREVGRENNPICWTTDSSALLVTRAGYLWRVPVDGGPAENMSLKTSVAIRKICGVDQVDLPVEFEGDLLVITTDETKLSDGLARFSLKTGQVTPVVEDAGYISQAVIGGNKDKLVYFAVKPDTIPQIFSRDLNEKGVGPGRQITDFKPELKGRALPLKKLLTFPTKDGKQLYGILFLPKPTAGAKKVPLILAPESLLSALRYGYIEAEGRGMLMRFRSFGARCYSRTADFYVRAGYAVLVFDFRLPGDWWGFADQNVKEYVRDLFEAAADAAIAHGQVDAEKIGVVADGSPAGDMMVANFTMMALTQTNRFKVASIIGGIGLPMAQALWADQTPWKEVRFMGNPHQVPVLINPMKTPERYLASAALPLMRSLKTPVLFMSTDSRTANGRQQSWGVPSTRTDELYNAANFAGTKSIAAFFSNPMGAAAEQSIRTLLWFNEHLRGGPAVAWRASLPRTVLINEQTGESVDLEDSPFDP